MFDEEINRYNTNCLKYDFKKDRGKPDDVFPMWIADMDFKCSEEILKDMHKRIDHGIFGYTKEDYEYFNAIKMWYLKNFKIELQKDWLVITPGVVFALATSIKILTEVNDYILINNPVYHPFTEVIEDNKRKVISSDLIKINNHYEIEFNDFENKIKNYNIKLFLLCSPHNPVGRVWKKEELDKIISICKKYNVYIVSDEIHSDFSWNNDHTCILKYQDYQDHLILCTSPSKTFNIAGLQVSNIFIPNSILKDKFQNEVWATGYSLVNTMGLIACKSAYLKGQDWLDNLKRYLINNINYVDSFLKEKLPKIKLVYPEGTYLLWLDFNELNLDSSEIDRILLEESKIWLNNGEMFGSTGKCFFRMNIALPREKLIEALNSLYNVFKDK